MTEKALQIMVPLCHCIEYFGSHAPDCPVQRRFDGLLLEKVVRDAHIDVLKDDVRRMKAALEGVATVTEFANLSPTTRFRLQELAAMAKDPVSAPSAAAPAVDRIFDSEGALPATVGADPEPPEDGECFRGGEAAAYLADQQAAARRLK